jgi:phosphoribosyl 1,2-cyclic phosphodiesterase
MKLHILSTGSKGNCYLLIDSQGHILCLEAGVRFDLIKKAIDYRINKVDACLITHEHLDHCKSAKDMIGAGVTTYASNGTHEKMKTGDSFFAKKAKSFEMVTICNRWKVIPFPIKHDAAEPMGYLISHKEMGNILFATDTYYIEHQFPDLNNIIVEANYDEEILMAKAPGFLANRILKSHMSIDTMIQFITTTDTKQVNNLVVCHLSDSNSNEKEFERRIKEETGCMQVHIATNGTTIDFNKTPF